MSTNQPSTAATLWTAEELSEIIGVPKGTLEQWRIRGLGPNWVKLGNTHKSGVRYRPEDVMAWKDSLPRFGPNGQAEKVA